MKRFLRIFAIAMILVAVGCNNEKPTPEPPTPDNVEKVEGTFSFTDEYASKNVISLNIHSNNPDMEYIVLLAEKKHFLLNGIDTRDELMQDDLSYVTGLASAYGANLHDFLQNSGMLTTGDYEGYLAVKLYPATEYVVYCYGVEFTKSGYKPTTEVCYTVIKTEGAEIESVEFDIECSADGNVADITFSPKGYDGYYYYYIVPEGATEYLEEGKAMDSVYTEIFGNRTYNLFNQWINNENRYVSDFCKQGKTTISERVVPNTRYMVVAFAVSEDSLPLLCSVPEVAYFTSGEFSKSELTLDVKVTDITPYNAQLTVTPSNDDEEYACVFIARSQQPKEVSDYEQMQIIIAQFDPAIFTGTISQALTPLMPSTEYVVLAFGIDTLNDLPTTDLYEVAFTSEEASDGSVEITSIEMLKVFDTNAIYAIDPSYRAMLGECECVAIVEAKTNVPCDKLYFWWYETWMKVEYNDEAFLEDLLMYPYANNPEVMDMYYSLNADDTFFFAGIAEDKNGNLGSIYYGEDFLLEESMVSPVEEFFDIVAKPSANRVILKR